jgi:hypothetical protein
MLDIFVGEAFAARALGQADTFARRAIVGFAVSSVEILNRCAAADAYRHAAWPNVAPAALLNCQSSLVEGFVLQ